jgi:hypothetical protein
MLMALTAPLTSTTVMATNGLPLLDPRGWGSSTYLLLIMGLLALNLVIPWPASGPIRFLGEVCLILPAGLFYFLVRGMADADPSRAMIHAEAIVAREEQLGIFVEPQLQAHIVDHPILVHLSNWVYVWGHWPVIIGAVIWLWTRHRESYPLYRNAVLISGAIGMVIFALYPVAPPRLVPDLGLVDTVTLQSRAYRLLQPPALANQYAAMPSLHFGWNLIVGIAIVRHAATPLGRLIGFLLPAAMFAAIVLTANHYILDGVFGGIVAMVGLAAALALSSSPLPQRRASLARSRRLRTIRSRSHGS